MGAFIAPTPMEALTGITERGGGHITVQDLTRNQDERLDGRLEHATGTAKVQNSYTLNNLVS
jgi:hypothetical protein